MMKEDFKYELMKSFHEQFAQNQNHHQNLFIQVVSILLTVVIGFGYTLYNFRITGSGCEKSASSLGVLEFTAAFTISEVILTLGVALVSNMALGFRRDQLMNTKIREAAGLTVDSTNKEKIEIFAKSYNPMKNYFEKVWINNKKIILDWMPNFHIIFSVALITVQSLLIIVYFIKLSFNGYLENHGANSFEYSSLLSIIGISATLFSIIIIRIFHNKLNRFYLINGMRDLIANRYSNEK